MSAQLVRPAARVLPGREDLLENRHQRLAPFRSGLRMFRLFRSKPKTATAPTPGAAMPYTSDLIDPKVMEQIGYLDLLSRTVVDGLLAGKHRSTTKGGCCEFAQHRQYAPGDEIRQIDWQVFARNDKYFIKQFEEETKEKV